MLKKNFTEKAKTTKSARFALLCVFPFFDFVRLFSYFRLLDIYIILIIIQFQSKYPIPDEENQEDVIRDRVTSEWILSYDKA